MNVKSRLINTIQEARSDMRQKQREEDMITGFILKGTTERQRRWCGLTISLISTYHPRHGIQIVVLCVTAEQKCELELTSHLLYVARGFKGGRKAGRVGQSWAGQGRQSRAGRAGREGDVGQKNRSGLVMTNSVVRH